MSRMYLNADVYGDVTGQNSSRINLNIKGSYITSTDSLITNAVRHAIDTTWFMDQYNDWQRLKAITPASKGTLNRQIGILKGGNAAALQELFNTKPGGTGPGEVMMMYLVEDSNLAGGTEGGDLRLKHGSQKKYEIKGAKYRQKDNSYGVFGIGNPWAEAAKTFKTQLETKPNTSKFSKYAVNKQDWKKEAIKNGEWKDIVAEYRKIVKGYFAAYPMILLDTKTFQIVHIGPIDVNKMVHPDVFAPVGGFQPRIHLNGVPKESDIG